MVDKNTSLKEILDLSIKDKRNRIELLPKLMLEHVLSDDDSDEYMIESTFGSSICIYLRTYDENRTLFVDIMYDNTVINEESFSFNPTQSLEFFIKEIKDRIKTIHKEFREYEDVLSDIYFTN